MVTYPAVLCTMKRSALFILCLAAVACTKQEELNLSRDVSAPVRINEVFATGGNSDDEEQGAGDWLELYNSGEDVALAPGEWFLTDDRDDPMKFELPGTTIDARQYVRIWCDGGDGPEIHAPFRLSSKGEWLALVRLNNGRPAIVDSLHYAPQTRKRTSASRYPDGADSWIKASAPTPGAANAPTVQLVVSAEE